jgi:DNA invertase Pin-like site-specific DNA recombinase
MGRRANAPSTATNYRVAGTPIEGLRKNRIGFKSVSDGAIDTTSASGEPIFDIFSALAQFERRLIHERTKAGLAGARVREKLRSPTNVVRCTENRAGSEALRRQIDTAR